MHLIRAGLGVATIPLLSGCMAMGGWGHAAGLAATDEAGHMGGGQPVTAAQYAEARGDGLLMVLSARVPAGGGVVTISAWLRADDGLEPADGEIWLRIRTPDGTVERLRMQEPRSDEGTHHARYAVTTAGVHVVTAEARSGTGPDARTVAVTIEVDAGDGRWDAHQHWLAPVAVVGGLGMLALMAVMMSGTAH